MEFLVEKKEGEKLRICHQSVFQRFYQQVKDGFYWLSITPFAEGKTDEQRGYYFGVVILLITWVVKFLGNNDWDKKKVRSIIEKEPLTVIEELWNYKTGVLIATNERIKSVAELDKNEMAKLIDYAVEWAQFHLDLTIPPPDNSDKSKQEKRADLEAVFQEYVRNLTE